MRSRGEMMTPAHAEWGSFGLEFYRLSKLTRDPKYFAAAEKIYKFVFNEFPTQVSCPVWLLNWNYTSLSQPGLVQFTWSPSLSMDTGCLSGLHLTTCTLFGSSISTTTLPIRLQGPETSLTGVLQQANCCDGRACL